MCIAVWKNGAGGTRAVREYLDASEVGVPETTRFKRVRRYGNTTVTSKP